MRFDNPSSEKKPQEQKSFQKRNKYTIPGILFMLASIVLIIMIVMHINAFYFEESYGGYSEYNTPAYTPNEYCKEVPNSSDAWYAGLECDEMKVKIYDLSWKFLLTFGLAIFCFKKNKS